MNLVRKLLLSFSLLLGVSGMRAQNCSGDFTWVVNGNTVGFLGTVTLNVNSITWSFGDSNYDYTNSSSTFHTYAQPGTYTVCILVMDTINNCSDSACHTIVIGNSTCTASFSTIDSAGYTYFINSSSLGQSGIYAWDFGDGNYSNDFSPSNMYQTGGYYQVCLIALDSMQNFCDSICMSIYVPVVGYAQLNNNLTDLQISPNPNHGFFSLNYTVTSANSVRFTIIDISGRVIDQQTVLLQAAGPHHQVFNTENYTSGVYFLRVESDGLFYNKRFIVAQHD
jgi:Secretion system C-terminal sorting domain/PKD domain